jgi:hypothetical protein
MGLGSSSLWRIHANRISRYSDMLAMLPYLGIEAFAAVHMYKYF